MKKWFLFSLFSFSLFVHATYENKYPSIAVDASGNITALWQGFNASNTRIVIKTASKTFGESWGSVSIISSESMDSFYPKISMNTSGQMLGIWQRNNSQYEVRSARASFGENWTSTQTISPDNALDDLYPEICIDGNGNAEAAWQLKSSSSFSVCSTTYSWEDNSWSTPTTMGKASSTFSQPKLAVNSLGDAIICWSQFVRLYNIIESRFKNAGESWDDTQTLSIPSADPLTNPTSPMVVMNDSKLAIAIWSLGEQAYSFIQARVRSTSGSWEDPQQISSPSNGERSINPQIAINNTGKAIAIWELQTSNTTATIQQLNT